MDSYDSYDSNDWDQSQPDPFGDFDSYSSNPSKRPRGSGLPLDRIKLKRDDPHPNPTGGVFEQAWHYVKDHPAPTLVMSVLTLMFSGNSCNVPSGNFGGGGSSSSYDSGGYDSGSYGGDGGGGGGYDYGSWFDGSDLLGQAGGGGLGDLAQAMPGGDALFGALGGAELGVIMAVMFVVFLFAIVMAFISAFIHSAGTSMWLRIVRGQDASFGSFFEVKRFVLPFFFTSLLMGIAVFLGILALVIPAIIMTYGFMFVKFVVIDKDIHYVDALKASWELTDGYKLQLFVWAILAFLLNLVGLMMCCFGIVVTNAITMGALTIIYDRIASPGHAYLNESEDVSAVFS